MGAFLLSGIVGFGVLGGTNSPFLAIAAFAATWALSPPSELRCTILR